MRRPLLAGGLALLVVTLAATLWLPPARRGLSGNAAALARYREGEDLQKAFRWHEARLALEEAVRLDPGFAMARAALAEQYAALGLSAESRREAAAADSLARLLRDETQRLVVQLRVSQFAEPFLARRDSLLALAERRAPDELLVAIARARTAEAREESAAEEAAWRRVLALDPNYANAYNQIGYIAAREGRYDEALNYLRKYVFLAPQLANPHDSLGEILFHAGRYEEAEQELWRALQIQPDFFPSLLTLGAIDMERGQVHKGVELLEKVRAQIAGSDWEPQVDATIIQTYYDHDLRPQLVTAIERRLERYPDEYRRDRYRALLAILTGRWQEAPALHAAFLAAARQQATVRGSPRQQERLRIDEEIIRAMIARERGDHAAAAAAYGRALSLLPDRPPHEVWSQRTRYGNALLASGQPAAALEQAQLVLAANPRRLSPLLLQVRAELALGRRAQAARALERLRKALAKADRDLPVVAAADSLARVLAPDAPAAPAAPPTPTAAASPRPPA